MNRGISERRRALGLTQGELAERAGVAQSLVSDAERGNRANPSKVGRILSALDEAESKNNRNSSGERERLPDETATQAAAMTHLTLVPQAPASTPTAATSPIDRE